MSNEETVTRGPLFVQYALLKIDPAWRRLDYAARKDGREAFARLVEEADPAIRTYPYSTLGLKTEGELLLWHKTTSPVDLQSHVARLLQTGIGQYLHLTINLWGFTRPSTYTRRPTTQEQAIDLEDRQTYLVVYPFSKTTDWYLMSKDARQGMMNEHMRVGHEFEDIRQVLLYSTGLDDQEFVVAYETEDLPRFSQLVVALRDTEARRYTLKDTPIVTGIKRDLREALEMIG